MFVSAAFVLSLASLVTAQSTNPTLEIEAIQAHFSNAGLVPSLLPTFAPTAFFNLSYSGVGAISLGQKLTKDREFITRTNDAINLANPAPAYVRARNLLEVSPTPQLTVTPANDTVKLEGNYTLVMADADVVGTDESKGQTRHWLVNDVTLTGVSRQSVHSTHADCPLLIQARLPSMCPQHLVWRSQSMQDPLQRRAAVPIGT